MRRDDLEVARIVAVAAFSENINSRMVGPACTVCCIHFLLYLYGHNLIDFTLLPTFVIATFRGHIILELCPLRKPLILT
jgi:hypothetical protein